ncbi:LPD29 domain-containing protein [Streptomyces europaeiscabiei]|uniref:LPD29 domain-containing protein n=1 Tax=Streptomyces europaeiscabiei TaxID=146819 RepID=UPI0038F683C5
MTKDDVMPLLSALPVSSPLLDAYAELRLPDGTSVERLADEPQGAVRWTVHPCACTVCLAATWAGEPPSRYELRAIGEDGASKTMAHVQYAAVVPLPHCDEILETRPVLATATDTAAHLRRQLRQAFPGVRFRVRRGKGSQRARFTVRWTGGPSRTEVSVVTAPLLADYTEGRRRPAPITVSRFGTTRHGVPVPTSLELQHL